MYCPLSIAYWDDHTLPLFYHRIKAEEKQPGKCFLKLIKFDVFSRILCRQGIIQFTKRNYGILWIFCLIYLHLFREVFRIRASSVLPNHGTQESVLRVPLELMVLWFFWYKKNKFTLNHYTTDKTKLSTLWRRRLLRINVTLWKKSVIALTQCELGSWQGWKT